MTTCHYIMAVINSDYILEQYPYTNLTNMSRSSLLYKHLEKLSNHLKAVTVCGLLCSRNVAQPLCLFDQFIWGSIWHSLLSYVLYTNSSSSADGCFIWLIASLTEWIRPSPVENWQHSRIALSLWLSQREFAAALHTDAPRHCTHTNKQRGTHERARKEITGRQVQWHADRWKCM